MAAADLLSGYSPAKANHNHVGYLRVFLGATQLISLNVLINVSDSSVPAVSVQVAGPQVIYSCNVANIWKPGLTFPPSGLDVQAVTQEFYQHFADECDLLNVVFTQPSYQFNRFHFVVHNDVQGIGLSVFDNAAAYGSAGTLRESVSFLSTRSLILRKRGTCTRSVTSGSTTAPTRRCNPEERTGRSARRPVA